MGDLYFKILYQPLFNLLIWLYNVIPGNDIGIAIILLTILIKIFLYPLTHKTLKAQKELQTIQPKIEQLKKQFKGQKEALAQEMMKLYKENKINPMSSCFPTLLQLPFIFAVYRVFTHGLASDNLDILYSYVQNPETVNTMFLGFFDLSKVNVFFAILVGVTQYIQTKMLMQKKQPAVGGSKDEAMAATMNKQMTYFLPLMTFIIGVTLPSGLTLYLLISILITIFQQKVLFNKKSKTDNTPEIVPTPEH